MMRRTCRKVSMFKRAIALFALLAVPALAAPPIGHVFVIVLENQDFDKTFGPATVAPYLGHVLPSKGALLTQYFATGHKSLDNYITLISGQPPTPATQMDCKTFIDFQQKGSPDAEGILPGDGCVYPAGIQTVADQLEARGLTWRGYMEEMGADPAREAATCAHPVIGGPGALPATPADNYAYKHNPFVYFHSIIDRQADCDADDVNLQKLKTDLKSIKTTPNLSFIVPGLCSDGHDNPCADKRVGGLVAIDPFLKVWVPRILHSPAFKKDGLLIITFDESGSDMNACCNEPSGPNTTQPGLIGAGGGRIGAVALSPFIKPGTVSDTPVNHYDLLRSIEDIFGLPPLGYAKDAKGLPDIFTRR
jgi:phospholipase C